MLPSRRHRRLPRLDLPAETYYATSCCLHRMRWFESPQLAEVVWEIILNHGRAAGSLHAAVVMPDHYHLLLTLGEKVRITRVIQVINSLTAREINARVGRSGAFWQRRFYDHVIRCEAELLEKLNYMHGNPCRAEIVASAVDYPYSSARFWMSQDRSRGEFATW